jgi:hypothetical protein
MCFSDEGTPLYASAETTLLAATVDASVSEDDFKVPYDVEADIGRCFPREDEPPRQIDVDRAIDHRDIEDALSSALLTLEDLDCTWSDPLDVDDESDENDDDCYQTCCAGPNRDELEFDEARTELAVIRDYSDLDPYEENHLRQSVRSYRDGIAAQYMQQVRDYWAACSEQTFENERGDLITMHATELTTHYGDESVGYLLTYNHNAYGDYVIQYVRKSDLVTVMSYYDGALGIRDPKRTRAVRPAEALLSLAAEKLEELAGRFDEARH